MRVAGRRGVRRVYYYHAPCALMQAKKANPGSHAASGICLLCGGRRTRTSDLWVMSPTSYHCSIPQYLCRFDVCKGTHFFRTGKFLAVKILLNNINVLFFAVPDLMQTVVYVYKRGSRGVSRVMWRLEWRRCPSFIFAPCCHGR